MNLRETLSFGFEQTFTTPDWWTDPGFVATSNTPLKVEKMKLLAEKLAEVTSGRWAESKDIYGHVQYETFGADGRASFVVTMDPGSIEVKSPPLFIAAVRDEMRALFEAAELAGLVAYRNWWYGVRTGTEGGCHVNMAGLTPETNPLRADPSLVVKYAAFFHNHPCIHYPFMGVDVGPGGNCMRMDEHALDPHSGHAPGAADSEERFAALAARINRGERPSAEEVAAHFKGSKLADDKHSAPSLYKYKAPLFFVEERAVEALRSPSEFHLVCDLRLRILERLREEKEVRPLGRFGPELHRERLSSLALWIEFERMAAELGLDPGAYRDFFDRQFPQLSMGESQPQLLEVREGRRPRVITGIQKRGELIISKTIDTSYARLELIWPEDPGRALALVMGGKRYAGAVHERFGGKVRGLVLDYRKPPDGAPLDLALIDAASGAVVERARFVPKDMMFRSPAFEVGVAAGEIAGGYVEVAKPGSPLS